MPVFQRVRSRFIFYTGALLVLVGILLLLGVRSATIALLSAEMEKRGLALARQAAGSSVKGILSDDRLELRAILKEFARNEEDVVYLVLYDRSQALLAHTFDGGFPEDLRLANLAEGPLPRTQRLSTGRGFIRDIALPIMDGSLGSLHVGISEEAVWRGIRRIMWIVAAVLLLATALAMGLDFFLSGMVLRPVIALTEAARELGEGNFGIQVPVLTRDEVGELARAFNSMAENIRRGSRELTDMNAELEAEIAHRTETEEDLRESKERFELLFQSINDIVFLYARKEDGSPGRFLEANDAALHRLLYNREELLGMSPRDLTPPGFVPEWEEMSRDVRSPRGTVFERILTAKDGTLLPVEFNARNITLHGQPCTLAIARDISERKKAERAMADSLQRKEVLLREIHHRVKNNLQVISSLLDVQSRQFTDASVREAYRDSERRIRAMALVHGSLYLSADTASVEMPGYIRNLTGTILESYSADQRGVSLELEVEPVRFPLDTVIPCGLILNELVANALKYAFPQGRSGCIRVEFRSLQPGAFTLSVSDDGVGLPEGFDPAKAASLGLKLVALLAEMMGGTLTIRKGKGTAFLVTGRYREAGTTLA